MNDNLIARLAAANPVPSDASIHPPESIRLPTRRLALAAALALAVAVPAIAFAGKLGTLIGISNEGTPVATSSLSLANLPTMQEAMQQLDFPSTMQLIGTRDGARFYAARNAAGRICFAVESPVGKGLGCQIDSSFDFPSREHPVIVFPPFHQLAGIAADGVATVAYLDAAGKTIASTPVTNNLFNSSAAIPDGAVASVEALDTDGNVISDWKVPSGGTG